MSYLKHWKLQRSPFSLSKNRRAFFAAGTVEEAIARTEFLLDHRKKLGVLIGPTGVGKTALLEHMVWLRNSKNTRESVVRIDLQSVNAANASTRIGQALGLRSTESKFDIWLSIQDHLFSEAAIGHRTIFLLDNIDEANEDSLLMLSQLWSSRLQWSTVISLDDEAIVDMPRWLLEQCELKIELPAWDLGQTADYFDFALAQEGNQDDIFDGQSITRIQELSQGIPRKIAQIAELALVAGAVRKSDRISTELVEQVCDEFTVSVGSKFPLFWEDQQLNVR